MPFDSLGLSEPLLRAIAEIGYQEPTPIQAETIPLVLGGRDVIGSAQTGTGKTAAFGLPILTMLKKHGRFRCLVLEPTRELAGQVDAAFRDYAKHTDLSICLLHGGVGYGPQRAQIAAGADIIIATPGRLLDYLDQGTFNLKSVEFLVLDEVDRMLDMGFLPDVRRIAGFCPAKKQVLLFTATLPPEIERLAAWTLRDPVTVEIGLRRSPAETVRHFFYPVAMDQKFDLLLAILENLHYESVLIFTRTKMAADRISDRLIRHEHKVAVLHSDRSQAERTQALAGFKSGKYEVMVATDLASRGLDVAGISHVINYDVPETPDDYIHRIGRTGRAEAEGDAFTLITADDIRAIHTIEHAVGTRIPRRTLENYPSHYTTLLDDQPISKKAVRPKFGRRRR